MLVEFWGFPSLLRLAQSAVEVSSGMLEGEVGFQVVAFWGENKEYGRGWESDERKERRERGVWLVCGA